MVRHNREAGTVSGPAVEDRKARLEWVREARFGMFVHWGLYSAAGRHEWVKQREHLDDAAYQRYFDHFSPDLFDPSEWAREAAGAGMKYVVVTAKHHEGFCLWDSALTDYKATNTPAARDLLRPVLDAFRDEGLRVGVYYSLLDWHHDQFPIDVFHPQAEDVAASRGRAMAKYTEYLHGQVRELLTGYGRIDYLFFDFSYPGRGPGGKGREAWCSEDLLALVRHLQPDIVVNDRLDVPGDIVTPEQYQPERSLTGADGASLWEACQTLNGSWGYDRDNLDWKSPDLLVRMLIDGVSKGGNLLLNVGPDARGRIGTKAVETLRAIGEWTASHGRSIYGAGPSAQRPPADCRFTEREGRLYLHLFAWPFGHVHLPGLGATVEYAQFLHDASEVRVEQIDPARKAQTTVMGGLPEGTVTLVLPVRRPPVAVPVIELFLRR
jgi:alpha-L-fucosidase